MDALLQRCARATPSEARDIRAVMTATDVSSIMDIVAAIALPIVFIVLILWLKQLLYDPSTDGLVLGVGLLALAGIVFLAWPLFELGFEFYGHLLASPAPA